MFLMVHWQLCGYKRGYLQHGADWRFFFQKDWEEIPFGVDNQVDSYALGFVRHAQVVRELKEFLKGMIFTLYITCYVK